MQNSKPPEQTADALISNVAEAEAYLTGFIDGTIIALALRPLDTSEIRARCAKMREFIDE
jgi:hypothetical protein